MIQPWVAVLGQLRYMVLFITLKSKLKFIRLLVANHLMGGKIFALVLLNNWPFRDLEKISLLKLMIKTELLPGGGGTHF